MGKLVRRSERSEIDAFLKEARSLTVPDSDAARLMFALDATASREPTWDRAASCQAEMFEAVRGIGELSLQLVFYRGHRELKASPWFRDPAPLVRMMQQVRCAAGITQIERVLAHAVRESRRNRVRAVVFVGDCMEEHPESVTRRAGELALLNVPVFMFQEGHDPMARETFAAVAAITRGAYSRFDEGSAQALRTLLKAVAVFATGGREALRALAHEPEAGRLLRQLSDSP